MEQVLGGPDGTVIGRSDVNWTGEDCRPRHVDIAVVMATTKTSLRGGSAVKSGVAATTMEAFKLRTYLTARTQVIPAILEGGGRWGPRFLKLLRSTFRESESASNAYQVISAVLQRCNANTLAAAAKKLVDDVRMDD